MKKISLFVFAICFASLSKAQTEKEALIEKRDKTLPDMVMVDMNGNTVNPSKISNNGKPIVINFWATWCSPCLRELSAIDEHYTDWQDELGVKVIAVAMDDERTKNRVKPYVDGRGWEYEVWLDPNWDFTRQMGVGNPPFTFIVDGNGKIVYEHNNYAPGDEIKLYEKLVEISKQSTPKE